ncbi:MAG: hypothetical protein ACD_4C00306G0002 [uncultured bacterium (gcode 4)]|uniref:Uncharacterized protein n=1 Tax=uncultured bacterium (gcode 4) TaxID=1234023 RepID=K2F5M6_9BACT|nr:MAG: hypothetical protein ACD_4C00306G0002 [uncultured bacterium (gcode 4)]
MEISRRLNMASKTTSKPASSFIGMLKLCYGRYHQYLMHISGWRWCPEEKQCRTRSVSTECSEYFRISYGPKNPATRFRNGTNPGFRKRPQSSSIRYLCLPGPIRFHREFVLPICQRWGMVHTLPKERQSCTTDSWTSTQAHSGHPWWKGEYLPGQPLVPELMSAPVPGFSELCPVAIQQGSPRAKTA